MVPHPPPPPHLPGDRVPTDAGSLDDSVVLSVSFCTHPPHDRPTRPSHRGGSRVPCPVPSLPYYQRDFSTCCFRPSTAASSINPSPWQLSLALAGQSVVSVPDFMTALPWGSLFFMCLRLLPVPQGPFFLLFPRGFLLFPHGTGSEASFLPSLASSPTPFSFPFRTDWVYLSGSPQTLVCPVEMRSSETLTTR